MPDKNRVPLAVDQRLYLGIILVLVLFLGYYNWKMALLGLIVLGSLVYYSWESSKRRKFSLEMYLKNLAMQAETTAHDIIYNLPWAVAVFDEKGIIRWCNQSFVDLFPDLDIIGDGVGEIFPEIKMEAGSKEFSSTRKGKVYEIHQHQVVIGEGRVKNYVLFVRECTAEEELRESYRREMPCFGYVQVDNYEEVIQSVEKEEQRPLLVATIDKALNEWAQKKDGLLHKYARDRYFILLNREMLEKCQEEKFPILDKIKEIALGNKMPVTLSCGFGIDSKNFAELTSLAAAGLDLALGRGGDQVAVRDKERFQFFGGKTKAPEKRTKVKARVIAQALRKLLDQSEQIFVMGHHSADLDSIGAAVGIAKAGRCLGKKAYVVLDEVSPGIEKLVLKLKENEAYKDILLTDKESLRMVNPHSLLVIVDVHKPSLVAVPELLNKTAKVVVIDHHRRGEEFISNPLLTYLETYASSTSEMVTELLQYLGEEVEITPLEASALLAGITVDTKNFSYQAGVRTFEAAAYLRRTGADPELVQFVLQDDWETFVSRAEIVKSAEIFFQRVALGVLEHPGAKGQLAVAQAADELLTIDGIDTSFVICPVGGGVSISARSNGEINVQVIMEKLGGGGHLSMAGAQLENASVQEAREKMVALIKEYFAKEDIE